MSLYAHAALVVMVAAVVVLSTCAHMSARWEGGFATAVGGGAPEVELMGVVAREPVPLASSGFDGQPRHAVSLSVAQWREANQDAWWRPSAATVDVIGTQDIGALAYGDNVTVTTKLDYRHGDRAIAVGWDATVSAVCGAGGVAGAVATVREDLRRSTQGLATTVKGLSRGMIIGDTRAMPGEQREEMRVAGLTHLTAVSGAHFAVVAVMVHGVLRRLRLWRGARALLAATGMAGFACLVFPDASVVRALVMALVGALAVWFGRPAHALPALATAVIVLVTVDPFVALEPGFALSVSAVAAIILWSPRLRVLLAKVMAPTPAMLIAVPLAAQAACGPILILLEPRVSLYSVFANLLAAPFAAPVTLIGLGAVILGPASLSAASAVAWLASIPVWPVALIAHGAASVPGATLQWPPGLPGALTLAALTCVSMWWTVRKGKRSFKVLVTAATLALVVLVASSDRTWDWVSPVPEQWSVVACDVGQGDMMMLRVGTHAAVVIDTGPGGGTAAACLSRYGVSEVPLLILTHPHADHDGGVPEVLSIASVEAAWVTQLATAQGFNQAVEQLADADVMAMAPSAGATWKQGSVSLTLREARAVTPTPVPDAELAGSVVNDASLVVSGVVDGVTLLALGDAETAAQQDLENSMQALVTVDVIKVAHHGSRVQDPSLMKKIRAGLAIVSVGAGNTYGHPSEEALELYAGTGARTVRTDECADIVVWRDPELRMASLCRSRMAG
ncbi:ComEC/Rec2 family competence protein [Demequina oxidasica]|uniref:ComEC/Rec2 family competence protein n=1 Tax=Demequina oxidasica TaxID=676199 RepID=UPI00136490E1|nr:ComEC/Rec2 family competence protein [Demequina oxidasica]